MRRRHLTTLLVLFALSSPALAVITGGKDEPMEIRGLPSGSLPLANLHTRIAWWVWCGSKDCLPRDHIASLVTDGRLRSIDVVFDGLLAIINGTKESMESEVPVENHAG